MYGYIVTYKKKGSVLMSPVSKKRHKKSSHVVSHDEFKRRQQAKAKAEPKKPEKPLNKPLYYTCCTLFTIVFLTLVILFWRTFILATLTGNGANTPVELIATYFTGYANGNVRQCMSTVYSYDNNYDNFKSNISADIKNMKQSGTIEIYDPANILIWEMGEGDLEATRTNVGNEAINSAADYSVIVPFIHHTKEGDTYDIRLYYVSMYTYGVKWYIYSMSTVQVYPIDTLEDLQAAYTELRTTAENPINGSAISSNEVPVTVTDPATDAGE